LQENYPQSLLWLKKYIDNSTSFNSKAIGSLWLGFYYYWLGKYNQSISVLEHAASLSKTVNNELWIADAQWLLAWIYLEIGEFTDSKLKFENWIHIAQSYFPTYRNYHQAYSLFFSTLLQLKMKNVDSAQANINEMSSLISQIDPYYKKETELYHNILSAENFLANNKPKKVFEIAHSKTFYRIPYYLNAWELLIYNIPYFNNILARSYYLNNDLDRAIDEYEKLINYNFAPQDIRLIHPKYHYLLAKLYEENNQSGLAIKEYEKFIEIWKEADADQPELIDAEKRLAVLQETAIK
jgi:tetratricopeptide (TPR) repeat protein